MVKIDSTKKAFEQVYETGKENAELIPKVDNWCNHLDIACFSNGMVAQMSGLVNEVSLTCPHASHPVKWYSVSYVAEEFIERNCLGCSFHKAKLEPNYGQEILAKIERKNQERIAEEEHREAKTQRLREEVEQLLKTGRKKANQTQLSILNLVSTLSKEEQRTESAAKLSAAAKLDPTFFSDAALEVLFLHFADEKAGKDCILAVTTVIAFRRELIPRAFDIACDQLSISHHFDALAGIFSLFINPDNAKEHISTIEKLIDKLWYRRFIGEPAKPERNFQQSEALLEKLGTETPEVLKDILIAQLSIDEKDKRLNINFLLHKLMGKLPALVSELTLPLIKSLELSDDQYETSSDHITIKTLCKLVKLFPESTIAALDAEIPKLSTDCHEAAIKINIELLSDRVFTGHHPEITKKLTEDLSGIMFNKNVSEKIKDEASKQLSYFVSDRPELFLAKFDGFLGYLSEIAESEKTFEYYHDEIKTKKPHEYTTFNYLIGKNVIEIDNEKQRLIRRYKDVKKILGTLCKADSGRNLPRVYSLIPHLDSKKDEKYKLELLSIITDYVKDPITIAGFMPQFYLHLLDPHSSSIRYKAMIFFNLILDRFPMLITSPLWDLFEVFIADKDILINGTAIKILGTIAEKMPERVSPEHLAFHRTALCSNNIFVNTSAIEISEHLFNFMSSKERYETLLLLLQLAEIYSKEDNKSYLSDVVDQIVAFGADRPKLIYQIAEKFLYPLTDNEEYYQAKEQIEKLERLVKQFPSIGPLWLKSALSFLSRFPNEGSSQDDRLELFFKMHRLDEITISEQLPEFIILISLPRTAMQAHLDIAHVLDLMGYFGFYEAIKDVTLRLTSQYSDVAANKPLLRSVNFWHQIAQSETLTDAKQRLTHLKEAENVFN